MRESTVLYCQMRVPVYYSDSVNMLCCIFRKSYYFLSIRKCIFSNSVITLSIPVIQWKNLSDSVIHFPYICVYNEIFFSNSIITFTYCVFHGILCLISIFAVTPVTMIFWFFIALTNFYILIYLGDNNFNRTYRI